jgi:aminoglycoside 6'-N-acetyltransferase
MPTLRGDHVVLRPLAPAHAERLRAIRDEPSVARWWGSLEDGFPLQDEPGATRFVIEVDGALAGMIQYGEEREPDYRHAWIDLFVATEHQGRGVGRDALRTLVGHLLDDRGHHRVTIDPMLANEAAVRCYEAAGFRRVGVLEAASRDPATGEWGDDLLMELVRLPRGGTASSPTGSSGSRRG